MVGTVDRTPPAPDLESLEDAGVPTVAEDEFEASLDELADRRRKLLTLVEFDSRRWPDPDADDR